MTKCLTALLCIAIGGACAIGQVRERPIPAAGAAVENQYIVTFRAGTSQAARAAVAARAGARVRFNYSIIDAIAITAPNANALAALAGDLAVLRITPDRISTTMAKPTKPGGGGGDGGGQIVGEGVNRVGLPASGNLYNVGVAVLDTGVARVSDLLVGEAFWDSYGGTCGDVDGHGTHVSGIIAAIDDNTGIVGVAPGVTIYCGKVLNDNGSGSDSDIIAGLNWVATEANRVSPPIRVVNMSLGRQMVTGDIDGDLRKAIQAVTALGIAVVVAAGNDASREVSQMVPAGFPESIAIASTTAVAGTNQCSRVSGPVAADTASFFTTDGMLSTEGIGVTISAPGEEKENISRGCFLSSIGILSLAPGGGTARMSGTSQAAPHVAGVVARMIHGGGVFTSPADFKSALRSGEPATPPVPLDSPASSYTFDGEREGIVKAP